MEKLNIHREVEIMRGRTVNQLRSKYLKVFGEYTKARNKPFLIKRIAWRLQANNEGGLSERAKKRAGEVANETDLRIRAPKDQLKDFFPSPVRSGMATPFSNSTKESNNGRTTALQPTR